MNTKKQIFPWNFKTVGIAGQSAGPSPTYLVSPQNPFNPSGSEIGFRIYPPPVIGGAGTILSGLYAIKRLSTHFNFTFYSGVSTPDQVIIGVVVRDNDSSWTAFNSLQMNVAAVAGTVDVTVDLTSLLIPNKANTVYFQFPIGAFNALNNGTINIWKLDMLYQAIGVHSEL